MSELTNMLEGLKLPQILNGVLTFAICFLVYKLLIRAIKKFIPRTKRWIPPTLHGSLLGLLKVALWTLIGVITAGSMGIPVTSLVALISIVGLAISLAVQGILNNVAGGMIILSSRPFSVGDFVTTADIEGTVESVNLIHTRLRTLDGRVVVIPNSTLHTSMLTNNTVSGVRRVDITIGISYDNNPDEVRAVLQGMLKEIAHIAQVPPPEVAVSGYNENDISYTLRVWTVPEHYFYVKDTINERIYFACRRAGVEMSYPHINVHMK